jgi:hypothetical protein
MAKFLVMLVLTSIALACPRTAAGSEPDAVVRRLYQEYSWEAVMAPDKAAISLVDQPRDVLALYFTPRLAAALYGDSVCATESHDICALDFSPIWGSQDPDVSDLEVTAGSNRDSVLVRYHGANGGQSVVLTYRLVQLKSGWRIADISYSQGQSLRSLLGVKE